MPRHSPAEKAEPRRALGPGCRNASFLTLSLPPFAGGVIPFWPYHCQPSFPQRAREGQQGTAGECHGTVWKVGARPTWRPNMTAS